MNSERGMTTIELVLSLCLIAILSKVAISSYSNFIIVTRISTATTELHAALLLARSEAIKLRGHVVICRSKNADSDFPFCDTTPAAQGSNSNWGDGWLIYVDVDRDGKLSTGDRIIRTQGKIFTSPEQGAIVPIPNRNQLTYNATGQLFATYMHFEINRPVSDKDVSHDRYLCLASGGRARVDRDACR
jgi:type IV fimbrial biogenesis protein FimT